MPSITKSYLAPNVNVGEDEKPHIKIFVWIQFSLLLEPNLLTTCCRRDGFLSIYLHFPRILEKVRAELDMLPKRKQEENNFWWFPRPGTVWSTLHTLSHLLLSTILWNSFHISYKRKIRQSKVKKLAKVMVLDGSRTWAYTDVLFPRRKQERRRSLLEHFMSTLRVESTTNPTKRDFCPLAQRYQPLSLLASGLPRLLKSNHSAFHWN